MHIDEMIQVLEAAKAGKKIQCRFRFGQGKEKWRAASVPFLGNFELFEYRAEPEPNIVYANIYPGGIVIHFSQNKEQTEKCARSGVMKKAARFVEVIDD